MRVGVISDTHGLLRPGVFDVFREVDHILHAGGFEIVVTHGDQFGHPTPATLHEAFPRAEIIVYGHTHQALLELVDRTVTVMNPGGAGQRRFDLQPSVGIMELEPGIPPRARLVALA